ncbi:hypothetical protein BC834DRAFT_834202, partial [Gloeopeniophorella convolvens]
PTVPSPARPPHVFDSDSRRPLAARLGRRAPSSAHSVQPSPLAVPVMYPAQPPRRSSPVIETRCSPQCPAQPARCTCYVPSPAPSPLLAGDRHPVQPTVPGPARSPYLFSLDACAARSLLD